MNDIPRPAVFFKSIVLWFCPASEQDVPEAESEHVDWVRAIPFIGMHLACIAVFFVSFSWFAVTVAALLYAIRVFTLTGWYHRYFSHRTFKTWRIVQLFFAVVGCSAV